MKTLYLGKTLDYFLHILVFPEILEADKVLFFRTEDGKAIGQPDEILQYIRGILYNMI